MTQKQILTIVIAAAVLIGLTLFSMREKLSPTSFPSSAPVGNEGSADNPSQGTRVYESDFYNLRFAYPDSYFLIERDVGTPETPQRAIILAENTQENRDVLEGRGDEPREGPTAITIDIYENPQELSAQDWVHSSTTWTLSDQILKPVNVSGHEGVAYHWSGLYEGTSTIISAGKYMYVASVTSLSAEDQMIQDYEALLGSLQLTE